MIKVDEQNEQLDWDIDWQRNEQTHVRVAQTALTRFCTIKEEDKPLMTKLFYETREIYIPLNKLNVFFKLFEFIHLL